MAFNITELTSAINKGGGLAKPNMFFVRITPPQGLQSAYSREAMYFCDAAQLPGINFSAVSVKAVGYGTSEQRPIDAGFSTMNTTFIVDAKGNALRFFQQWLALINNWSRESTGVMRGTGLTYGEWNYPVTYEGTVEILAMNPVNQDKQEIINYQLVRAFPLQVGDINVAWEMNDAIMRLPVVFAYNTWNTSNVPPVSSNEALNASELATSSNQLITNQYGYGLTLLQNGNPTPSAASQFANLS